MHRVQEMHNRQILWMESKKDASVISPTLQATTEPQAAAAAARCLSVCLFVRPSAYISDISDVFIQFIGLDRSTQFQIKTTRTTTVMNRSSSVPVPYIK